MEVPPVGALVVATVVAVVVGMGVAGLAAAGEFQPELIRDFTSKIRGTI